MSALRPIDPTKARDIIIDFAAYAQAAARDHDVDLWSVLMAMSSATALLIARHARDDAQFKQAADVVRQAFERAISKGRSP